MIHPTAIIDPKAQVDPTVQVGPYAVIDAQVSIGPHCVIGPYVYLTGRTTIGPHNRFYPGAVIGDAPQDLKYRGQPSRLRIGEGNTFREHTTIHRSNTPETETVIGNHNLLMAHSHVAHDTVLDNHIIVVNGALISGHVHIQDRALISGNCLVHQFVRIGTLAMMQGGSAISQDLPPYTVVWGENHLCGLNIVGLRRAGFTAAQRLELKQLYHLLFRNRTRFSEAVQAARARFTSPQALCLIDFVAASRRGLCHDTGRPRTNRQPVTQS